MEFFDRITRLASRLPQQLAVLKTEEATKNALVMPLINALGYNVFDPLEVVPEFTADVGTKKGEKVDYAITIDGKPMILIECKTVGSTLSLNHASQLYRYFSVTDARFAVLTNGTDYWFYTDLESPNRMDDRPFFEFSMYDVSERSMLELEKFSRANFNLDNILSNARELKYLKLLTKAIITEMESPSEEIVRLFANRVYTGQFRGGVKDQFTGLLTTAFRDVVRDQLNARLKTALDGNAHSAPAPVSAPAADPAAATASEGGIETTPEELEGFHIVRAILAKDFDPSRIVFRDAKSYAAILLDDNNRRPICRLHFNYSQKYLGLLNEAKEETRIPLTALRDIYSHAGELLAAAHRYDAKAVVKETL